LVITSPPAETKKPEPSEAFAAEPDSEISILTTRSPN